MSNNSLRRKSHSISFYSFVALFIMMVAAACNKHVGDQPYNPASAHSADVLDKWMVMQIRLMKNSSGIPNQSLSRQYAYAGVAALEAIAPGIGREKSHFRWNGLTGLPVAKQFKRYYYPANVNAALAAVNRAMFPNATAEDKNAIDSLEAALQQSFLQKAPQSVITTSTEFGKAVAVAVLNWAENDGNKNSSNPYTIPEGPGLWVKTPPANANPSTPYFGNNRTMVAGSIDNTDPGAPLVYSEQTGSPFYLMVKEVYDASLSLTEDQKAMALYWRDVPGVTTPGHWLSILLQVVRQKHSRLDQAAIAYAVTGAAINDAAISCWKAKYTYNLVRPITYIRNVMGHTNWNSFLANPPHPEYASGHAVISSAAAAAFTGVFGNIGSFTDHTYDYLGYPARTFSSFQAIGEEAAISRLYAGIHFTPTLASGLIQGRKVAANILNSGKNLAF